jgi:hypothetical protein
LAAADGEADSAIARKLEINRKTVMVWRDRFREGGVESLWEVVDGAAQADLRRQKDQSHRERNSANEAARNYALELSHDGGGAGVSKSTISNIWRSHNLKPHRSETFKLSRDVRFLEKLTDVVGLYLNPPKQAIVLCVDEKSQIQALDRTQPGLPLNKGRCGTMTHDYKRNGTTTLFAALEVLQGRVVGECFERHRHQEFLKVPTPSECRVSCSHAVAPRDGQLRNALPSQSEKLAPAHLRFVAHFLSTSSSWLNLVERWFGELTSKRIRRGSFVSVADLEKAIEEFLAAWNAAPKPFVWTATVDSIQQKLSRCRQTLEQIQPGCTSPRRKTQQGLSS